MDDYKAVRWGKDVTGQGRQRRVNEPGGVCHARTYRWGLLVLGVMFMGWWSGCATPKLSDEAELAAFEAAGPVRPKLDFARLREARRRTGPYRVVVGDVLSLSMPAILQLCKEELPEWTGRDKPYLTRVDETGAIVLPVVGPIPASGRTLTEVEAAITSAFYPGYMVRRPAVVAQVAEYQTGQVSIVGAVREPGVYELRSDELSLVALLMRAGGIEEDGAAVIRIIRPGDNRPEEPMALPVQGLNVPFADAALEPGDKVVVEGLSPQIFTVIGLVNKSGAFEYPEGAEYNLLQALAFAGGVDPVADPRYVKIYRQREDGTILSGTFKLNGTGLPNGRSVKIKPGDVVAVEQTDYTRTRVLMAEIFRVGLGANFVYRIDNDNDSD